MYARCSPAGEHMGTEPLRKGFFFLSFFFALILFVKAAGVDDGQSGSVALLQVTGIAFVEVKRGR